MFKQIALIWALLANDGNLCNVTLSKLGDRWVADGFATLFTRLGQWWFCVLSSRGNVDIFNIFLTSGTDFVWRIVQIGQPHFSIVWQHTCFLYKVSSTKWCTWGYRKSFKIRDQVPINNQLLWGNTTRKRNRKVRFMKSFISCLL